MKKMILGTKCMFSSFKSKSDFTIIFWIRKPRTNTWSEELTSLRNLGPDRDQKHLKSDFPEQDPIFSKVIRPEPADHDQWKSGYLGPSESDLYGLIQTNRSRNWRSGDKSRINDFDQETEWSFEIKVMSEFPKKF